MSTVAPPASRNSPCPCGSGRRYKDCHGAIDASTGTSSSAVSSYRAPASEWDGIPGDEQDRLGALMERALAHQLAGRSDEAARDYRQVLLAAPRTHDALHMLGVVELGAGNLEEAERLIGGALALRPAYPTIAHNMELVRDALATRDRVRPEALCEHALPLLVELALTPRDAVARKRADPSSLVHLIGRTDAAGHDEGWLLRRLAKLLAPARPALWATDAIPYADVDGALATGIDAASGTVPQAGVHVFVGTSLPDTSWIEQSQADNVVVVCTAEPPSHLLDALRAIALDGARSVELVFVNAALATRFGGVGTVLPLPIELPPATRRTRASAAATGKPARFVAGVIGQDSPNVAEAERHELLSSIARRAGELAIYDPGRLRYPLGGDPAVRFVPRTTDWFASFLASIDCLVHRARPWWEEGDGRMLLRAMAFGIPVICPRDSLFATEIRNGVDGLLYADDAEALQLIDDLHLTPARAQALGAAARAKATMRFDPATLGAQYEAALLGPAPAAAGATAGRLRVA